MAPRALGRSPIGMAVVAWQIWQRLPPGTRRHALRVARKHGLKVATTHGPRFATLVAKCGLASKRR